MDINEHELIEENGKECRWILLSLDEYKRISINSKKSERFTFIFLLSFVYMYIGMPVL